MEVVHSRLEQVQLPVKVDVLVSEPMGTLLVNERMLETYLYARDHFLKPGGKMFPVHLMNAAIAERVCMDVSSASKYIDACAMCKLMPISC